MDRCNDFCCNASLSNSFLNELGRLSTRWKDTELKEVDLYISNWRYKLVKRCFDVISSITSIIILIVPFIILLFISKCMILFGWHTPGPLFLFSHRIGRDESVFTIYKLRTMPTNIHTTQNWGEHWNKQRFGRWGCFLRKSRFDELPQLLNVLFGQMSLVGPRPEAPFTYNNYILYLPSYRKRVQNILPGITGTGQLKIFTVQPRDIYRRCYLDLFYIQHRSLSYDLLILLRTAKLWPRLIGEAFEELLMPVEDVP